MNRKKGISMIAIVITVGIILIISSSVIYEYKSNVVESQKRDLALEFYKINQLVKDYEFVNGKYPITDDVVKIEVPTGYDEQFNNEPGLKKSDRIVELQVLDINKLNVDKIGMGTGSTLNSDVFAISEWTKRVYYLKGITIENKSYYTLTSDLYELLDVSEVK